MQQTIVDMIVDKMLPVWVQTVETTDRTKLLVDDIQIIQ